MFVRNLTSNVAFFAINTLASIWFIAYLIRHLGIAVYGLIPLALTVTSYMNLLTLGLNAAVGRYMTIVLEQSKSKEASRIFNTALWGSVVIIVVLAVPGILLALYADTLFNVPTGYESGVKWLFAATVAAFLITTLGSTFNIVPYCRNRFDLQNLANISGVVIRIVSVVVLFTLFSPHLWHVNVGIVAAAMVSFFVTVKVCHNLLPELKIDFREFDYQTLKKISTTGVWILISQVGTILLLSVDLLVANKLFGADLAGRYASVLQWSSLLRNFGTVVAGIFGPTILAYYARNEIESLINYSRRAVKFVGIIIALPVGLICGFSTPLLNVWLGPDFVPLAPLMSLMTFHLCLNLGYMPLHSISMATNRVKVPALVQISIGVLNLFLAIFLARNLGMGLYGIALAGAIVLTLRNIIFTPLYSSYILNKPYLTFVNELCPIISVAAFVSILSWGLSLLINLATWGHLILGSCIIAAIYFLFSWIFLISNEDRLLLTNWVNSLKTGVVLKGYVKTS